MHKFRFVFFLIFHTPFYENKVNVSFRLNVFTRKSISIFFYREYNSRETKRGIWLKDILLENKSTYIRISIYNYWDMYNFVR